MFFHDNDAMFDDDYEIAEVFVPMFGECSFTYPHLSKRSGNYPDGVFVPMFGGMFFHKMKIDGVNITWDEACFRPHVWGMFFHMHNCVECVKTTCILFSSPCLGNVLSPHWWYPRSAVNKLMFSSPCLGNVLSRTGDSGLDSILERGEFSSPCLGNVLSHHNSILPIIKYIVIFGFRPHVWGMFFHDDVL